MGVDIDAFIEYDDSQVGDEGYSAPFSKGNSKVIPWDNTSLTSGKDYAFIGALCGVRASRGEPLFRRRGLPTHLAPQIDQAINSIYHPELNVVSWLNLAEIRQALEHMQITKSEISLEAETVLQMMTSLASRLGEERVRLVFGVE